MDIDEMPEPEIKLCYICEDMKPCEDVRTCPLCSKGICTSCDDWACENPECNGDFVCSDCRAGDYCDVECNAEHLNADKARLEAEQRVIFDKAKLKNDKLGIEIDSLNLELSKLVGK